MSGCHGEEGGVHQPSVVAISAWLLTAGQPGASEARVAGRRCGFGSQNGTEPCNSQRGCWIISNPEAREKVSTGFKAVVACMLSPTPSWGAVEVLLLLSVGDRRLKLLQSAPLPSSL